MLTHCGCRRSAIRHIVGTIYPLLPTPHSYVLATQPHCLAAVNVLTGSLYRHMT